MKKETSKLSRRSFLELSAIAAGATAGGMLTGCSPKVAPEVEDTPANPTPGSTEAPAAVASTVHDGTFDWEYPPEPIPADQISSTLETEIVIIGAGTAGCCAALTAAEAGAKTVVLQKFTGVLTNGAGVATYNSKLAQKNGVEIDLEDLINTWTYMSDNRTDATMLRDVWAKYSGPTLDWMIEEIQGSDEAVVTAEVSPLPPATYVNFMNQLKSISYPVATSFNSMMSVIHVLAQKAEQLGVQFMWNTPADRLIREDQGRVTGVIAKDADGKYIQVNASKAVILCAGDYAGNMEMRSKWLQHAVDFQSPYKPAVNQGDGFKMAMWIGAAIDPAPHTSNIHFDTYFTDTEHPFAGAAPWLWVNKNGQRFCNEDVAYQHIYAQDVNQPGHMHFQIFDADGSQYLEKFQPGGSFRGGRIQLAVPGWKKILNDAGVSTDGMADWDIVVAAAVQKGLILKADTIEELAGKMECDAGALQTTSDRYNELAAKGVDEDFGKIGDRVTPIKTAPFYATPRYPMPLGVLSGVTINTKMEVLDTEGKVIPGLYAAGNNSGGNWFAGLVQPMCVPGMTLGRASTTGRLAVQNCLEA